MQVFKMRLVMGKTPNYNANGKLKNKVITPKYTGEFELENILRDNNWRMLGACEISCVSVVDYDKKTGETKPNEGLKTKVNERIKDDIEASKKPKTQAQLLKEQSDQMAIMAAKIEELEKGNKSNKAPDDEYRNNLISKANELNIQYDKRIGNVKLLAKINAIEPEFKL